MTDGFVPPKTRIKVETNNLGEKKYKPEVYIQTPFDNVETWNVISSEYVSFYRPFVYNYLSQYKKHSLEWAKDVIDAYLKQEKTVWEKETKSITYIKYP